MATPIPSPADFGGRCLVGRCAFEAALVDPGSTYLGLRKEGSYLYGTWRDAAGNLLRALRQVGPERSDLCFVFSSAPGTHLAREQGVEGSLWQGPVDFSLREDTATFTSPAGHDGDAPPFEFVHEPDGCSWTDGVAIDITGALLGPAMQWFNTWADGACYSVSAKYRSSGFVLGRAVEGFVGHEIHYFTFGASWFASPYAAGREVCWQQVANEYEDGTTVQATFAYGSEGWGFAMVQDEDGAFHSSTEVEAEATVLESGYPSTITYRFESQSWTWRIDPQGQRAPILPGSPLLGADGTCTRDGDDRTVRLSMGNSDWWTDGRARSIIRT